jgi:hypothetical protein
MKLLKKSMVNLSHALATLPILAKDLKLFGFAIF